MSKEIERKYLVTGHGYRAMARGYIDIEQGYLCSYSAGTGAAATVRVRLWGDRGYLTVKSPVQGFSRDEWEYEIPAEDARAMMSLATGTIAKRRYFVEYEGYTWEVDEFAGRHSGLVIAEIELPAEDTQFELPPFAGPEVTGDPRYYNSALAASAGESSLT